MARMSSRIIITSRGRKEKEGRKKNRMKLSLHFLLTTASLHGVHEDERRKERDRMNYTFSISSYTSLVLRWVMRGRQANSSSVSQTNASFAFQANFFLTQPEIAKGWMKKCQTLSLSLKQKGRCCVLLSFLFCLSPLLQHSVAMSHWRRKYKKTFCEWMYRKNCECKVVRKIETKWQKQRATTKRRRWRGGRKGKGSLTLTVCLTSLQLF